MCNKATYPNRKEAVSFLHAIYEEGRKDQKMPKRVYFCEFCQGWHITKSEGDIPVSFEFILPRDIEIVEKINQIIHDNRTTGST